MNNIQNRVTTCGMVKVEWRIRYTASGKNMRQFAQNYGIPHGTLWRFINDPGYEPRDPALRAKLGLPIRIEVDADLCSCGRAFPKRAGRKWCGKACSCREYRRRKREAV